MKYFTTFRNVSRSIYIIFVFPSNIYDICLLEMYLESILDSTTLWFDTPILNLTLNNHFNGLRFCGFYFIEYIKILNDRFFSEKWKNDFVCRNNSESEYKFWKFQIFFFHFRRFLITVSELFEFQLRNKKWAMFNLNSVQSPNMWHVWNVSTWLKCSLAVCSHFKVNNYIV